jgi:hypothetical protein
VQHSSTSHNSDDPTLTKLLEADSTLQDQEATLAAQLKALQTKRQSLKVVIDIFQTGDTPTLDPVATAALPDVAALVGDESSDATPSPAAPKPQPKQASQKATRTAKTSRSSRASKSTPRSTSAPRLTPRPARRPATSKKRPAEPSGWQPYVKPEFGTGALSEIVIKVLKDYPNRVFEVADLVEILFEKQTPQEVNMRARDRISHILSEGARRNQWYRPKPGFYSMSKTTA